MVTERPKQSVQAFFNSNVKPFFGNKSPTELCKELDDAIRCLNSTIGKPYIDSFDYSGVGNLERFLTENKDDPNLESVLNLTKGESASTVLHYVADWNAEAVDLLLKAGANPNICDENGKSVIEYVIDSAYKDYTNIYHYPYIIALLIKAGADPNVQNQGRTVLEFIIDAIDYSNKDECIEIVKLLIAAEVDINLMDESSGRTLLHHAAATGQENIVDLLLQSTEGEKRTQLINAQDDNGDTPLHCAVESSGYSNIVELLLEYEASCTIQNNQGETPLHVASHKSDRRNIEPFFGKGLDIDVKNGDGATPLLIASKFISAQIVKSFLDNKANAHAKDKYDNTALHYAANHERTNDEEECNQLFDESNKNLPPDDNDIEDNEKIIQILIKEDVKVNDKNKYGHTPLFFAVEHRKYSNAELLLKNGADLNIADENGFTVFHFAIRQKELHTLKTLLPKIIEEDQHGNSQEYIDIESAKRALSVIDNEGNTLLHHAIKWGCDEEILSFLIKHGVDINKKNNNGIAPIHIAAKYGDLDQINFLINRGADLNVQCGHLSRSVINNIGKAKELSNDSTDAYINVQDNTINVNNTEHTNATSLAVVTEDSSRNNVTTFLSAGGNPSIADGRNWLPLHIAIKRASEEGCTEEEREERLEIVRSLASFSHVEFLVSQGVDEKSEIWKGQFFKEVKNSLTDALAVTDNKKVQKKVTEAFHDLMLQVTRNKEEINRILKDAIEVRSSEKFPSAPVFDENFYDLIGSHVKKPTIYSDLFEELVGGDDWMDEWDLQGDHEGLHSQKRGTIEEIENEDAWDRGFAESTKKIAEMIEGSEWGEAGDTPEASGAGSSTPQKSINSCMNLQKSTLYKPIHDNKDKPSEKPNEFRESSFKLSLNQKIQLNKFLNRVSKAQNILELDKIVDEALKAGIRINCAQGNKDTFANVVLFKAFQLKLDPKIASSIVCKLVSKGAVFGESYDKISDELKKSEIFEDHEVNLEKAKQAFDQYSNKFKEIAKSAINHGKLQNSEIDNTTFYLEYSEDSVVDVTKVIGGAKSLGISSGGVVKVGENSVEIEIKDGIKNYANLSGNGCVALTLKGLEVILYHDAHNKDRVIVEVSDNDRKKLDGLSDEEKKKVWGKYQLGRIPLCNAIKQGYFERSSAGKLQASETISISVQEKVGEIIKSLNTNDITTHSLVNSSVSDVQLSKIAPQSKGRMHG